MGIFMWGNDEDRDDPNVFDHRTRKALADENLGHKKDSERAIAKRAEDAKIAAMEKEEGKGGWFRW